MQLSAHQSATHAKLFGKRPCEIKSAL